MIIKILHCFIAATCKILKMLALSFLRIELVNFCPLIFRVQLHKRGGLLYRVKGGKTKTAAALA